MKIIKYALNILSRLYLLKTNFFVDLSFHELSPTRLCLLKKGLLANVFKWRLAELSRRV